jgi:hypothetical protein
VRPVIQVRQLTKRYGATAAVDQLSFDVRPGVVTGFLAMSILPTWASEQRSPALAGGLLGGVEDVGVVGVERVHRCSRGSSRGCY